MKNNRLKIIHIGGNLRINGISHFIMSVYQKLHLDYEFIIINTASTEGHYKQEIENLRGKVYNVSVSGSGLLRSLKQAKEIRKIIHLEKPDAVHSHYFSNNGIFLKMACLEGVPIRISHCHQANNKLSFRKKIAKLFSIQLINRYATHKFACSEKARKFLYKNDGIVINHPIDYNKFQVYSNKNKIYNKFNLLLSNKYLVFIGRLVPQKNPFFLLSVMKKIIKFRKDIKLIIVGDGILKKEMIVRIHSEKLKEYIFILPPHSNVSELINIAEYVLLPSLYEGLGAVLIEAQISGVSCISSPCSTEDAQLGLCAYLTLNPKTWCEYIVNHIENSSQKDSIYYSLFDQQNTAFILDMVYRNATSTDWIAHGKEFTLGSRQHYRNKELASYCFKMAKYLNDPLGIFYYALACFEGNGVPKNRKYAHNLISKIYSRIRKQALIKNKADYLLILADMYSFGLYNKQDFKKAFVLYSRSAELGNIEAQCNLGYMYIVGQGVSIDKKLSSYWWKKSADLGFIHSMRDIGQNLLTGQGIEKNPKEACKYFKMASDANYSHGTADLAFCYLTGTGIKQSLNKAIDMFLLAYKQDKERTVRDLISFGIKITELIENRNLVIEESTAITELNQDNTFQNTLVINEKIETIDPNCFYHVTSLEKIFVEKDNPYFCFADNVLFNKDKTKLIRYPIGNTATSYTIPESVKKIGEHAFQNARNLIEIVLPESIVQIEKSAFDDCKKLKKINLPNSLTKIDEWAFHACDSLKNINLPQNLSYIGFYAFGSCENLQKIYISTFNMFYHTEKGNLFNKDKTVLIQYAIGKKSKYYALPHSVKEISFRGFSDAYYLEELVCQNVSIVEEKAFYYAQNLKKIVFTQSPLYKGSQIYEHTHSQLEIVIKKR